MDFFSLRCFVEVARSGSFTRAADLLGRTQPAISQQITGLEQDLDTSLLDRTRKQIRLTESGQRLFDEAIQLLERFDALPQVVADDQRPLDGTLTIASNLTLINLMLPDIIGRFRKEHPAVRISLSNGTSSGIARDVAEGRADLGLGYLFTSQRDGNI